MNHLKRLGDQHYRAMALRMEGKTYPEIAAEVGRSAGAVANWFSQDPLFQQAWDELRADSVERARVIIENAAPSAARHLVLLMEHRVGVVALGAVRDILDRSGLKPTEKLEATIDDAGLTDTDRAARIAQLLDRARARRDGSVVDGGDGDHLDAAAGAADTGV